jgi:hypothetical protein
MVSDLGLIELLVGIHLYKSYDHLTEAIIGKAHYHSVAHRGMGPQCYFDLLRVDFLAAAVDHQSFATHESDDPICLNGGEVAARRPSAPIEFEKRRRRLRVVLVVANRKPTSRDEAADQTRSWCNKLASLGNYFRERTGREAGAASDRVSRRRG